MLCTFAHTHNPHYWFDLDLRTGMPTRAHLGWNLRGMALVRPPQGRWMHRARRPRLRELQPDSEAAARAAANSSPELNGSSPHTPSHLGTYSPREAQPETPNALTPFLRGQGVQCSKGEEFMLYPRQRRTVGYARRRRPMALFPPAAARAWLFY